MTNAKEETFDEYLKEETIDMMFRRTVVLAAKAGLRLRSVDDGYLAELAIQSFKDGVHPNVLIRQSIKESAGSHDGRLERKIDSHWLTLIHVGPVPEQPFDWPSEEIPMRHAAKH